MAKNLYIAPDGKDNAAGTLEAPFKTLTAALNRVQTLSETCWDGEVTINLRGEYIRSTSPFSSASTRLSPYGPTRASRQFLTEAAAFQALRRASLTAFAAGRQSSKTANISTPFLSTASAEAELPCRKRAFTILKACPASRSICRSIYPATAL